ncbi:V-type proton ATPase subunit G1-like isoform X1 [Syzygium oleosum]|uniref:V-type proton ATPase subunit G1-like isoform X1 n=1 Tax=Syzygium oleosum TaxID=219896 RepID=UPI0024BB5165|nr:V-type proton ATPase subunit G1-like isoform X1 [Syzygium oleosum]
MHLEFFCLHQLLYVASLRSLDLPLHSWVFLFCIHFQFVTLIRVRFVIELHSAMSSGFTMDSMKGQGGIQMLLTAEQEAQQIISSAKNLKITRLKQAKEEAEKDVATYRSQLEAENQKRIAETGGASGANVQRLEEETDAKIKNLKESASVVSGDITEMLIKYVTTVKV